jgi:hydrogenase expression/formation protein HypC
MCLAIPGKLISTETSNGVRLGKVQFGGEVRSACLDLVPDARPGDYLIIHVGFAINRVEPEEAESNLLALEEAERLRSESA